MRIVAGSSGGRQIETPEGTTTRPTTDRVRESMFNALFSLGAIDGADVLDLFAGSGALGLEALSRGAAHVTFVESNRDAVAVIERNIATLGFEDQATLVTAEAMGWLARTTQPFDLVVCDPPYAFDQWTELLDRVAQAVAGGAETMFVIESNQELADHSAWGVLRTKRYGSTIVTILTSSV